MNYKIYYNAGIYYGTGTDMLFIAIPGYFASSAWCESDDAYNKVSGQKFEAITADDCKSWNIGRDAIRRIDEDDNIDDLLDNAHEDFVKLWNKKFIIK